MFLSDTNLVIEDNLVTFVEFETVMKKVGIIFEYQELNPRLSVFSSLSISILTRIHLLTDVVRLRRTRANKWYKVNCTVYYDISDKDISSHEDYIKEGFV